MGKARAHVQFAATDRRSGQGPSLTARRMVTASRGAHVPVMSRLMSATAAWQLRESEA
jgi:hypothetical protein